MKRHERIERGRRKVKLFPKDTNPPSLKTRVIQHNHGFRVREDRRDDKGVKDVIIIERPPRRARGKFLTLEGTIDTDIDLVYGSLSVFDSAGAVDHFADMDVKRNGRWRIRIRNAWLKGRAYPVFVDPTLQVNSNDIHLFRDTGSGGCFAGDTRVSMADGNHKPIRDIAIGDETSGGRVIAVVAVESMPLLVDYRGIHVTSDHPVKHDGRWQLAGAIWGIRAVKHDGPVFLFETTSMTFHAQTPGGELVLFSAYDGVRDDTQTHYQRAVAERLQLRDDNDTRTVAERRP